MPDRERIERALCEIWQDLLGVPASASDDFFELGGYSLLVVNVVVEARQRGITLVPNDIFVHKTPAAIATALADGDPATRSQDLRGSGRELGAYWLSGMSGHDPARG